jgi:hypothetical protein
VSRYAKTAAAFLGGVATWGATAVADNAVTPVEWFGLLAAVAAVLAVWGVPNSPPAEPEQ